MDMDTKPALIESGTKYFLRETLKSCNKKRTNYYNDLTNLGLLLGFILVFGGVIMLNTKHVQMKKQEKRKNR